MNIQSMMKQAQKLQNDMMKAKKEIDETVFENKKSFLSIKMTGDKKIKDLKIELDNIEKDEIEMIEDLILVAVNELIDKIDKETETKIGKYTKGMPGLF